MLFGAGARNIISNGSTTAQKIFNGAKNMPLFGVSRTGEAKIVENINNIVKPFTRDAREARAVLKQSGEEHAKALGNYAKDYNAANGITGLGSTLKTQLGMENEIAKASMMTGDAGATAMREVGTKYGINQADLAGYKSYIGEVGKQNQGYIDAAKNVGGAIKNYMMDGSPLSMYAKGAAAVTAMQYMNGSRSGISGLVTQNGERDIAGIPFV